MPNRFFEFLEDGSFLWPREKSKAAKRVYSLDGFATSQIPDVAVMPGKQPCM
jgi:hypothetical protein